ncbi:MAG TPA: HAMP domain-containing sensor histidine kinase [Tepidisphaeraceae bacterium]|jgi:signal transduction histidine kinase|nr:HAMP domain-containing sensor histidine kinase [Tepidisphaeraceae bacterium]
MTRRLSILILLLVWAALIAGGAVAYLTCRTVLLADLDAALLRRARALPEVAQTAEAAPPLEESAGDRYVVANHFNQTQARMADGDSSARPVVLHSALAVLGDGSFVRTLTLRFTPRDGRGFITVVYSGSAQRMADLLSRLAWGLTLFGIVAGIIAAGLAVAVSRAALRPLRVTADAINAIDEQKLEQRLDAASLPMELQPVARQINAALDRIQSVFEGRKQFLADVSHELRTPVAALLTTLEVTLRRPREAGELTRALRTCMSDAKMLHQLILALLEHARGEVAGLSDGVEIFDAAALFRQCVDVALGLSLERKISLRLDLPDELMVRTQPQRLRGIVMNLLGNAVEHNRTGGSVELAAHAEEGALAFSVRDTGPGIAAPDLPDVFQPFYRAKNSRNTADSGVNSPHLGLGLFLVDSHIKALGGKCEVQSEVGVGTTISVHLPGAIAAPMMELEALAS